MTAAMPCGYSVASSSCELRMCSGRRLGIAVETDQPIDRIGRRGLARCPAPASRRRPAQSCGTLKAVRASVFRTYRYSGCPQALSAHQERRLPARRGPRTACGTVIDIIMGVLGPERDPFRAVSARSGPALKLRGQGRFGRPSNGIESAIVVRVDTPALLAQASDQVLEVGRWCASAPSGRSSSRPPR